MNKHKLDLELVLPTDAAACDACVKRLLETLRVQAGVDDAHVDAADASKPKLCLHYDSSAVRLEKIETLVQHAGVQLRARFEHISVPVVGLRHERQAKVVEDLLTKHPGVLHATVSFGAGRLFIELDPSKVSQAALLAVAASAGVVLRKDAPSAEKHEHGAHSGLFGERTELIFSLACGALTALGWLLSKTNVPSMVSTGLFVVAYALGSWFTVQEVSVALRARRFEIDFLMLVAAIGAAVLGEWLEGALLLFLFTLGHALEGYAMGRARHAIEALSKLAPATAVRIDDAGREQEVPIAEVLVGHRLLVKPNTRIPADGFVVAGSSSVNQAPFYRALAVLVAASPCALGIATPSAVLSGVARAARAGVLVKGGAHLEALGLIKIIAFDKTGTLTEGRPR